MTQPIAECSKSPYYYTSFSNALATIYRTEGVKSLYKGLGPSILGVSHVMIQFPLYEHFKTRLAAGGVPTNNLDQISTNHILFASALSKLFASCITYPHEIVRTRLQTQLTTTPLHHERFSSQKPGVKIKYDGILSTIKIVWREEGLRGFYAGFGVSLGRTIPASAATILTFEVLSQKLAYFSE